jgi:hypothetical protein
MIEVLKQCLEAMKNGVDGQTSIEMDEAITSLRQAIAELESQEPVAWYYPGGSPDQCTTDKAYAEMEPAWTPLYTHPPQRSESSGKPSAWVGLTDEELTDLFYNTNLGQQSAVSQAVALLKQKNT